MLPAVTPNEVLELLPYLKPHEIAEIDQLLTSAPIPSIEATNLTAFKRALYKRYKHAPHLEVLDRALENVELFVKTRGNDGTWLLIVEMPPRHGKTLTTSRYFPAWFLGKNPDCRVMLVSYAQALANKNSRMARSITQSPEFNVIFPGFALDKSSKAVDAWDIERYEGGTDALGVLGGATGKGAHLLIMDDLMKSRKESESELIRSNTWDAIMDDLLSRSEPGGAVVLMATRWHQDDPIGRMLNLISDPQKCLGPVKRLRLVALPEIEEDYKADQEAGIERDPSGALWPERYPARVLNAIRERSAPYSWSSLYQQRPTPAEGGIFKRAWFEPPVTHPPQFEHAVRYWDLAMSAKTSADYTVGLKLGFATDGHHYVLDVVRKQIDWGELTDFMAGVMLRDGPHVAQGIEQKGYMSRAVQDLNVDSRLHGYVIMGYPVDTDKLTRALPAAARAAAGMLHVLAGHWTDTLIDELCSFPNAAHDDQVDALSGAWAMIGSQMGAGELYLSDQDTFGIGPY